MAASSPVSSSPAPLLVVPSLPFQQLGEDKKTSKEYQQKSVIAQYTPEYFDDLEQQVREKKVDAQLLNSIARDVFLLLESYQVFADHLGVEDKDETYNFKKAYERFLKLPQHQDPRFANESRILKKLEAIYHQLDQTSALSVAPTPEKTTETSAILPRTSPDLSPPISREALDQGSLTTFNERIKKPELIGGIMAAKPVIIQPPALQLEALQTLATALSIPTDGDVTTVQQRCFDRAVALCRENIHWELIQDKRASLGLITNAAGRSLLLHAVEVDEPTWVERLIHYRVGSLKKDGNGNNALHAAASKGAVHLFHNLAAVGIDDPNNDGELPIHSAIKEGHNRAVEVLIGYHARLDLPVTLDGVALSALPFAVARGQIACSDVLVQKGRCPLTQKIPGIGNLLHVAIHFKQPRLLRHLIRTYREIRQLLNEPNDQGLTPLSYAAQRGELRALRILTSAKTSLDQPDGQGQTALHHAALHHQYAAVETLIYLGAKLNVEDKTHQTPLSILKSIKDDDADTLVKKIDLALRSGERFSLVEKSLTFPENGAFKGGGVKGTSYGGVARAFAARHALGFFKRFAGTSAGALTASIFAVDYPAAEVEHILLTKNFLDFLDHPFTESNLKKAFGTSFGRTLKTLLNIFTTITDPVKLIDTLWHQTGLCEGEVLRKWLEELIAKKVEEKIGRRIDYLTFGELADLIEQGYPFKHLHVYATRVGKPPAIVCFSSESKDPAIRNVIISDAGTCSASIPGVFQARNIYIKQGKDRVVWKEFGSFVDGGVLYNLPVETFDMKKYMQEHASEEEGLFPVFNTQTVGFDLRSSGDIKKPNQEVTTVGELLGGLVNVYVHAESLIRGLNPYHKTRLVEIDIGQVSATDFCMTDAQKQILIKSGFDAATQYLSRIPPRASFAGIELSYPLYPQDLHQQLCAALRTTRFSLAEQLLSLGMDIDQLADDRGNTAVHAFAEKVNLPALEFLDKQGASLDKSNLDGLTPFHSAVVKGQIPALDWLMKKNPGCLQQKTKEGKTSMQLAVEKGKLDALSWLLQQSPSMFDPTLLPVAIESQRSDIIQKIIEQLNFPDLDLSRKELSDQKAERVLKALESVSCVQILNLKRNNLGPRIGPALRSLLQSNQHLIQLNLERNTLEGEGASALAEGLKKHRSLQVLNLMGNDIGDMGGLALAQVLPTLSLEDLNLASNGLTDATIVALAEALKGNRSLKVLSLWGNLISYQAACSLLDTLKDITTLKELYIHGSDAMTQQERDSLKSRKLNFNLNI